MEDRLLIFLLTIGFVKSWDLYIYWGNQTFQAIDKINFDLENNNWDRNRLFQWQASLPTIYGSFDLKSESYHDIRSGEFFFFFF